MATKTVLVCVGERRRPVTLSSSASLSDLETSIRSAFADVLNLSTSIVLQVKDEAWGLFIDLQNDEFPDRSIVNVVVIHHAVDKESCSVDSEV